MGRRTCPVEGATVKRRLLTESSHNPHTNLTPAAYNRRLFEVACLFAPGSIRHAIGSACSC
jgi:hypothetical protein